MMFKRILTMDELIEFNNCDVFDYENPELLK